MGETRVKDDSQTPTTREMEAKAEENDKDLNLEIQIEKKDHSVKVCHHEHISA